MEAKEATAIVSIGKGGNKLSGGKAGAFPSVIKQYREAEKGGMTKVDLGPPRNAGQKRKGILKTSL